MSISAPFIVRPIATTLLMAGLTLVGLAAYFALPIAGVPQVDIPTVQISAELPGASAETMATSVATPLERQLALISGVTSISSGSSLGRTSIQVEFELGRSIDGAAQDIQTAINAAGGQLPKNLPNPPTYEKVNPADAQLMSIAVDVRRPADLQGGRLRRELHGAADLAHLRGRAGRFPRRAEARRAGADQSHGRGVARA